MKTIFNLARKDTPGCEKTLHFNNAGASLMPGCVIEAVNSFFALEAQIGGYEAARAKESEITDFYKVAARLINASPQEMAFIESGTRAWDMIFYALDFKPGDTILTTHAEYASNHIAFLHAVKKFGVKIEVLEEGFTLTEFKNKINASVKLIAITHIPAYGGTISPVEAIGGIARDAGIFYLLDATQSVGQIPLDVEKIQCDALAASGRKFLRGPRGTGFIYVRQSQIEKLTPPFLDMRAAVWTAVDDFQIRNEAIRFETWEKNYSNLLGLKKAMEYALELGIENIQERIRHLSDLLRKILSEIEGIRLVFDQSPCGIIAFTKEGVACPQLQAKLEEKQINVSLLRLSSNPRLFKEKGLAQALRASVHYYNSEEEIFKFCQILKDYG